LIRIGLLGCGRIARIHHIPILARESGVELATLADPDPGRRADARASVPRARESSDWRAVLDDDSIDAVVICLPTGLHAAAARASFEAGKDVYLEKPVAMTLDGARDAARAWRASGRIGMVGFNQRFHPLVLKARDLIREGRIGRLIAARASTLSARRELPEWKRRRAEGGGALLDLASHHADLARFLFAEEVREVSASVRSIFSEDDDASITMTMESGLRMDSRVSFATVGESRFEVLGDQGRIVVDRVEGRMHVDPLEAPSGAVARLAREATRLVGAPRAARSILSRAEDPSYRGALSAFAKATRDRTRPSPDIEDGVRSLAIVLAAETAAREGYRRPVEALAS
jgi:myo-inositol 2-dehydrogenase/D-chiro-inositol 1-dehydrogenase